MASVRKHGGSQLRWFDRKLAVECSVQADGRTLLIRSIHTNGWKVADTRKMAEKFRNADGSLNVATIRAIIAKREDRYEIGEHRIPSMDTLRRMAFDQADCEATDGCRVEPDGKCEHGFRSWLLVAGVI